MILRRVVETHVFETRVFETRVFETRVVEARNVRSGSAAAQSVAGSRVRASRIAAVLSILALLGASGCKKDSANEKKAETTPTTTTQAKDKKTGKLPEPGIDVPTEEDFEDAIEQQITPETDLNKELDQIEKQINE
jgi:hypothetical protein